MSRMSHRINSLSSTGSLIGGGEQRVVGLRIVGTELALARGFQLFPQPRRLQVKLLLFHPTQERLPRHFVRVGVPFGQLLPYEFLDRLRESDFHAPKLAQNGRTDNAQIHRPRAAGRIVKTEPSNPEPLPLSLLNDYLYCPRRA